MTIPPTNCFWLLFIIHKISFSTTTTFLSGTGGSGVNLCLVISCFVTKKWSKYLDNPNKISNFTAESII